MACSVKNLRQRAKLAATATSDMLLGGAPCQMADPWRRQQVFDGTGHQKSTSTHLNARFCKTRLETPGKLLTNLSARRVNPRFP